jgi:plasmid stabilization system protein ParE
VKLIVSPEAIDDLREIEKYIGQENPKASVEFVAELT